jgi:hypothetical protein
MKPEVLTPVKVYDRKNVHCRNIREGEINQMRIQGHFLEEENLS